MTQTYKDDGVTAAKINADVAGSGLVQNGTSGALDVNVDELSLTIASDVISIKENGVSLNAINFFSTDATLGGATPSDLLVSSQAAVKAYADKLMEELNAVQVPAAVALSAKQLINLFDDNGTVKARLANATDNTKPANGYVLEDVAQGSTAIVHKIGLITELSGLTVGSTYYLSTTSGAYTTTAPVASGNIIQKLGKANTASIMSFVEDDYIEVE